MSRLNIILSFPSLIAPFYNKFRFPILYADYIFSSYPPSTITISPYKHPYTATPDY